MVAIIIEHADGRSEQIDIVIGATLMQGARDALVDGVIGECGGSLVCGTCHVKIGEPWASRVRPISDEERALLDCGLEVSADSRLGCQIIVEPDMAGMIIALPSAQR